MTLRPGPRKLVLTAHVSTSVGWFGSVAAFLALAVAGLTAEAAATVRGAYVAAEIVTWAVIVPLCLASLVTGVLAAVGSPWGLFRHYWVVAKLVLTLAATLLLLLHTRPIGVLGAAAAGPSGVSAGLDGLRVQPLVDALLALLVLVLTTVLAVYKPRGVIRSRRPA